MWIMNFSTELVVDLNIRLVLLNNPTQKLQIQNFELVDKNADKIIALMSE